LIFQIETCHWGGKLQTGAGEPKCWLLGLRWSLLATYVARSAWSMYSSMELERVNPQKPP
jgi:hypothetical protein